MRKRLDAFEDVLRARWLEVGKELLVDREVGREDEEVSAQSGHVEVADESAHQPRLSDARGKREAQADELAFELLDLRVLLADFSQSIVDVDFDPELVQYAEKDN